MPHRLCVDLRPIVRGLLNVGVRVILAHPEAVPELLHDAGAIEQIIEAGCLVQVSARNIAEPATGQDERALRSWVRRGIVHVLGSDGHSVNRRPPIIAEAYHRVVRWGGRATADRVARIHGLAILQGLPLRIPQPERRRRHWFSRLWPAFR
jgi:protein-tyrosine phosphatase